MPRSSPRRACVAATVAVAAVFALVPASASAQATRTWVSGVGDDVNPCSRTAPCKTFAGAISKTADSGEISVLDPGGFGAVTITKGITIDGGGITGSVLASSVNGVIVNTTIGDRDVVLRNLSINGAGPGSTTCGTGLNGVRILRARNVTLEDVTINEFTQSGVAVENAAGLLAPNVLLNRVDIRNTCQNGVNVAPAVGTTANVLLRDTTISQTGNGVRAGDGANAGMTRSTIFDAALGLAPIAGGKIDDLGDNVLRGNDADGAFTGPPAAPAPAPVTVTQTVTAPPTTVTVPGPTVAATFPACTVPALKGLTRSVATTRLSKAGCALGPVTTRRTSRRSQVGKVVSQRTSAGRQTRTGTKVALVLGR